MTSGAWCLLGVGVGFSGIGVRVDATGGRRKIVHEECGGGKTKDKSQQKQSKSAILVHFDDRDL
jgi:hypothetical protein